MEEPTKKDMVDTTDCLEAVSAFKAMKNFLFLVLLISLVIIHHQVSRFSVAHTIPLLCGLLLVPTLLQP